MVAIMGHGANADDDDFVLTFLDSGTFHLTCQILQRTAKDFPEIG